MPSCVVLGCTSGSSSNNQRVDYFNVPKDDEALELWRTALRRGDFIKSGQRVCGNHFHPDEIETQKVYYAPDGSVLGVAAYKSVRLKRGTVPSIFPWSELIERNPTIAVSPIPPTSPSIPASPSPLTSSIKDSTKESTCQRSPTSIQDAPYMSTSKTVAPKESGHSSMYNKTLFNDLLNNQLFWIPEDWVRANVALQDSRAIMFTHTQRRKVGNSIKMLYSKEVIVNEDLTVQVQIMFQEIDITSLGIKEVITTINDLQDVLSTLDGYRVCSGCDVAQATQEILSSSVSYCDVVGTLRHKKCILLLGNGMKCKFCVILLQTMQRKRQRSEQRGKSSRTYLNCSPRREDVETIRKLSRKRDRAKRINQRKVKELKNELFKMRLEICNLDTKKLDHDFTNQKVPNHQQTAIREIIAAARCKSPKGRRYSEEWILLCMLFSMRSAVGYDFIRSHGILPLPDIRTVRRYLQLIDSCCGFDPKFFELFERCLAEKPPQERHGLLLLDEISTRKSIRVDSQNLTYKGFTDFGSDEFKATDLTAKADHCLVLMFQPLNASYTQPCGVFASTGQVRGTVIAQLIIKAITLLKKAGATVLGVVTDGAAPNRKFWKEVGVDGNKDTLRNYFVHPTDGDRKMYVFSDTPHLIKTIRNRLAASQLQMDPSVHPIEWEYFRILREKDMILAPEMRMCPKITDQHINLTNSAKMRVRLATQIFSKTTARGLRMYRHHVQELRDCESTAIFCEWINDMFDALNRRSEIFGVVPGNHDFKVISLLLINKVVMLRKLR